MAFTCGFYNSVNHDRKYDAVQHGMIFDGIITDGIYATYLKAMVVKASSNPSEVIVQPGRAWFNHTWSYNDADYPVAAPDPEVVLDRIDTLVLDINSEDAVRDNQFIWVQGTPTSQVPEPPELIHTATHNQYPLCDVYRQAGTTQIYAADITNRVGTSDCPFVTGVLEGINIDDLLAQWDDEFHTWENATKASFEGWMLNQQAVYSAWWDSLKTQMAGDVADVEEWVQTIKDIIDEETATHLQLEIDEINSMLPSGSHITVTTADTELYSRAVTITDEDDNTLTSQFDATGVAVFKSVPYVGNLTIEATDGIRTATAVVNTPYFARYEFPLAFWSATVNITGGTELGGETVTITDSSQILVGTVVLNASGTGVFNATYPDTYKFSVTHGGQTMEVSLAVTQETTYNVTIHAGFNWRGWVDTAQYLDSSDYDSLDEVLADELAVRELCLEHACVDYLAAVPSVNADIETVINNDLFAKWANNSDYSLDILGANVAIKALMDTADKYGYGEWALVGQIPKMSGNSSPYGNVYVDSTLSGGAAHYEDYYPVNGDGGATKWYSSQSRDRHYWCYKFPEPVCAKRVYIWIDWAQTFTLQASNDNSSWTDLYDEYTPTNGEKITWDLDNDNSYLYYRIITAGGINMYIGINEFQIYAWAPKGNVPVMTSDSAPYGEASASSEYDSTMAAWKAFDGDEATSWNTRVETNATLTYKFTNPICPKRVKIRPLYNVSGRVKNFKIQGSSDGTTFEDLTETLQCTNTSDNQYFDIDTDNYYLYLRIAVADAWGAYYIGIITAQFYGRELSVSVPKMDTNTTPYGEAFYSNGNSSYPAYMAFDGNSASYAAFNNQVNEYIGYEFPSAIVATSLFISGDASSGTEFYIEGANSKTGTYTVLGSFQGIGAAKTVNFSNTTAYKSYRLRIKTKAETWNRINVYTLQFYGLDYSEKEFETGTTKKWLYDHGVKLEEITYNEGSYGSHQETDSGIILRNSNASSGAAFGVFAENLTNFNLARAKVTQTNDTGGIDMRVLDTSYGYIAGVAISSNKPNNIGLDVSSINSDILIGFCVQGNLYMEFNEMWLE